MKKKKKSLSLSFLGSEFQQILTGSSTEHLTELKSRCQPTEYSSGVLTKEKYISKLPLVVDRICFPVVIDYGPHYLAGY